MEGYIASIVTSFNEIPGIICSAVFLSGCSFNCEGCQNPELQTLKYGQKMLLDDVVNKVHFNKLTSWVCFLGGEPFFQHEFLFNLCSCIQKPIGIYTGNDFDVISQKYSHIISLPNVKFLKTGRYMRELSIEEEFPITSNQQIYLKKNNIWSKCSGRNIYLVEKNIFEI